jgi:hypothetical protein
LETKNRKPQELQKRAGDHNLAKDDDVAVSDVMALMHTLLFAYQRKLKDILGTGATIFTHPVIETIRVVNEEKGLNLIEGDTLDQIFENFSQKLMNAKVAKKVEFEKLSPKKYVLHIDECMYAEHIHHLLKPKDVTCPWALLAMSIFESVVGKEVKNAESEFTELGSKTKIEC